MLNLKLQTFIFLALIPTLVACGSSTRARTLEDDIREYLYKRQPTTGQQFVDWANTSLADYSPRQIQTALYTEGQFQAGLGHPNAVGVLSFAAQAWAKENGLPYDCNDWLALQEEAMSNLRSEPGELQLWPNNSK